MAATKVQANWTNVSLGNTAITRINNIVCNQGGSLETYKGDTDVFPTVTAHLNSMPRVTVTSADIATLHGFGLGYVALFSATHLDAKLASGGAIVWNLLGATVENADAQGPHAQFGSGTLSLIGQSADGVTSPLSFSRV